METDLRTHVWTSMRTDSRTYQETHPWISFELDLRHADYRIWLLLGEAQSKCEQIARSPLLPEVADLLHRVYLAKGVLATTAIEGNTLTEEEVQKLLDGELKLPPSKEYLGQEVKNIIGACNLISRRILGDYSTELCVGSIKEYNRLVLMDLPLDEDIIPGQIREYSVGVGRYRAAPPEDCEYLLARLCDWLNGGFPAPNGYEVALGILKAILAHVYLAWIHPFADGNGRTARLVELQILLSVGVPTAAAHLLSNHYNQTRTKYYQQLDRTHRSGGKVFPFFEYASEGFVDGLEEQLGTFIMSQQLTVHWRNYVHSVFDGKDRPTDIRRRRLILDLSTEGDPVPVSQMRHITPRIAEAYANRTLKTVQRDIAHLQELGLVAITPDGVRARTEKMMAFLPKTRTGD